MKVMRDQSHVNVAAVSRVLCSVDTMTQTNENGASSTTQYMQYREVPFQYRNA